MDDRNAADDERNEMLAQFQLAIQEYLNTMDGDPSFMEGEEEPAGPSQLRHRHGHPPADIDADAYVNGPPPRLYRAPPPDRNQGWFAWLYELAKLPFQFTSHIVWEFYFFISSLLFPRYRQVTDPTADVTSFITSFEESYGTEHPVFYPGSYAMALADAKKELRFLLVYMHNPSHQDTDRFCRTVLCNREVIDFINMNALFWACSVKSPEGYRVSKAMRESTYPFMALICLRNGKMMIVLRSEGMVQPNDLIAMLGVAIQDNDTFLNLARQERPALQMNSMLMNEQKQAYEDSLREDRKREEAHSLGYFQASTPDELYVDERAETGLRRQFTRRSKTRRGA